MFSQDLNSQSVFNCAALPQQDVIDETTRAPRPSLVLVRLVSKLGLDTIGTLDQQAWSLISVPRKSLLTQAYQDQAWYALSASFVFNQRTQTKLADCHFSVAAPVVWNAVPQDIRSCSTITSFNLHLKLTSVPSGVSIYLILATNKEWKELYKLRHSSRSEDIWGPKMMKQPLNTYSLIQ